MKPETKRAGLAGKAARVALAMVLAVGMTALYAIADEGGATAVQAAGQQAVPTAQSQAAEQQGGQSTVQGVRPVSQATDRGWLAAGETAQAEGPASEEGAGKEASEDAADKEPKGKDAPAMPVFKDSVEVDGVKIAVTADEGAFPEGCTLQARAVAGGERSADQNVALSRTFDIKVLDKDGREVQPAGGKKVVVCFFAPQVADANLDTRVYHEAQELPVATVGTAAMAVSDGFSLYTVEFTYGDLQYVMEGDTTVPLADVLAYVGLTGEPTAVATSAPELFSASNASGRWMVTAHQAFTSTEWMKVTIDGVEYEIVVTDAIFKTSQTITLDPMWDFELYTGGAGKYFVCNNSATYTINGGGATVQYPNGSGSKITTNSWSATISANGTLTVNGTNCGKLSNGKNAWHLYYNEWASTPYGNGALVWAQDYVAPPTWKVTYNGNAGSDSVTGMPSGNPVTVNQGSSTTLPNVSRSGYTLNGWYTAASGGTKVGNGGGSYKPTGDITLYAQWSLAQAKAPTISNVSGATLTYGYAANSGSVSVSATAASGHTITKYQWYDNGTTNSNSGGTAIAGATSATYSIPAGKEPGSYYYYCVVTAQRTDNKLTATATSKVATVNVNKIDINPTVSLEGWAYGDTPKEPSVTGNTDNGTVTYTYQVDKTGEWTSTKPTAAGTHNVRASIAETAHYNAGTATSEFTIGKKEVGLVWGATSFTYDGKAHIPTATATGLEGGDTCTVTVTGEQTNAGSAYTATASDLSNPNYKLSTENTTATFSIAKRPVTVTAATQSVLMGDAVVQGVDKAMLTGAVNGHVLADVELVPSSTEHATTNGTITPREAKITSGGTDVTANYEIAYADGRMIVQGKVYYVKQNDDLTWPDNVADAESETRPGEGTTFAITKAYEHYKVSGYSTSYPKGESERTAAHPGGTITVPDDPDALYVYYSIDTYNLRFYADREGKTVWKTVSVGFGRDLSALAPSVSDVGEWSGDNQLSAQNSELYTFGGWATEPGKTVWSLDGKGALAEAFNWNQTMPDRDVDVFPVWVANYINVRLDLGAYDEVAVGDVAAGRNTWYDASRYDENTPASMGSPTWGTEGYQGRSFWKSTNITATSTDYDKYVDMSIMNTATRVGYTLDGWYAGNGMKWDSHTLIAREYGDRDADGNLKLTYDAPYRNETYTITLTARWNPNDAKVAYDVGKGSGDFTDSATYKVGDSISIPSTEPTPPAAETDESGATVATYEFKGWQDKKGNLHQPGESVVYADDAMVTEYGDVNQIKLTAVYQRIPTGGSLVFESQGGSLVEPATGDAGTSVNLSGNEYKPTRTGYTFGGWYEESDCTTPVGNSVAIQSEKKTVYAKWTPEKHTLSFNTRGGTAVGSITEDYGTAVTAPTNPTRTGYVFKSWDKTVPAKMPAADMTISALWTADDKTVTYDFNDGGVTPNITETRRYGEFVVEPTAPTREGHTFYGWMSSTTSGDTRAATFPFVMSDWNVTLQAVWKVNQTAPNPPVVDKVDPTQITLKDVEDDVEYILVPRDTKLTDEDWKNAKKKGASSDPITFTDLVPNTPYDAYARKIETEATGTTLGKAPSPAAGPTQATTPKQDQAAPAAPTVKPAGATAIAVDSTHAGVEYAIVPEDQQLPSDPDWKSPDEEGGTVVFTGLNPDTDYEVYARMKETERQYASPASDPSSPAKTLKLPELTTPPTVVEGLVYDSQSQELLEAGSTEQGAIFYRLGENGEWSEGVVPSGTDAGAYDMWYMVRGDVGNGFGDTEPVELKNAIAKALPTMTVPVGKVLTYNGAVQALAEGGSAEGGTLLYALAADGAEPAPESFSEELPAATDVGDYRVWCMIKGDANHEDLVAQAPVEASIAEVDKADLNEVIDEAEAFHERIKDDYPDEAKALKDAVDAAEAVFGNKNVTAEQVAAALQALQQAREKADADVVAYFCLSGSGATWTKGSSDPLAFVFKRSIDDDKTFEAFTGAKVDGADVPESAFTKAEGSLALSLTAAYLETLSAGDHELAVAFEDGEAAATFAVKAADAVVPPSDEDDPSKETPAKETPAKETPAKETPAKETLAKETLAKETLAKEAPAKGAPANAATSPKTGDALPVALLAVVAAMSATVLIVSRIRARKVRVDKRTR